MNDFDRLAALIDAAPVSREDRESLLTDAREATDSGSEVAVRIVERSIETVADINTAVLERFKCRGVN